MSFYVIILFDFYIIEELHYQVGLANNVVYLYQNESFDFLEANANCILITCQLTNQKNGEIGKPLSLLY